MCTLSMVGALILLTGSFQSSSRYLTKHSAKVRMLFPKRQHLTLHQNFAILNVLGGSKNDYLEGVKKEIEFGSSQLTKQYELDE